MNGQGDETKAHCAGCTELLAQISDLTFFCLNLPFYDVVI
ncbi:hypothetical protein D917_07440 [Trichinella nativa]|uniref:Uncharacterized protein n=1 Tax=Trichinella nativa TaxID=6335 RepID=A0A1Y3EPH4_9BILA|nr:hypothetical protein D917_07440 [Trichinella nativa]